jgi:ribosome modulation factor
MSAEDDRKRHERAKEQGRQARRAGRKQDACPYRAGTSGDERTSWLLGWDEENMARKQRR